MTALKSFLTSPSSIEIKRPLHLNLAAWIFWLTFVQSFLIDRVLVIATFGRYRIGAVVFLIGLVFLFTQLRLVNRQLLAGLGLLGIVALISAMVNDASAVQIISFIRIPLTVYIIYHIVTAYMNSRSRAKTVLRIMYLLALVQLPILIVQRLAYPFVPARLKLAAFQEQLASVDFGMGTFNGDAPMSFFLIALLILLLFEKKSREIVRYKWFTAIWMTLTVIVGNSQIQHLVVIGVWLAFFLSHLNFKTLAAVFLGLILVAGAIGFLDQSNILTFSPLQHTQARATKIFSTTGRQERIELFLSGYHARDGAIYYYLEQPINWIGDGPGRYYNTFTRERTLGSWGHVFTFYAEVGLIGLFLSLLIFFIIAFPFSFSQSKVSVKISWVQALMFLSVCILSIARYPMNTIPMIFTFCIVLIGHRMIATPKQLRLF